MMRIARLVLLLILLSGISCKVYVVDRNSGTTITPDGSLESPFKTIQDCVDALKAGSPGNLLLLNQTFASRC